MILYEFAIVANEIDFVGNDSTQSLIPWCRIVIRTQITILF